METQNLENEKTSKQGPFIGHILKYELQVFNTVSNEYTLYKVLVSCSTRVRSEVTMRTYDLTQWVNKEIPLGYIQPRVKFNPVKVIGVFSTYIVR